jgi:hypothetical protein
VLVFQVKKKLSRILILKEAYVFIFATAKLLWCKKKALRQMTQKAVKK